ncbi:MAG: DNA-binding protein [Bacteroidetes bacterium]|nr:DNA-binding protein [Bacteroidota bacterium]
MFKYYFLLTLGLSAGIVASAQVKTIPAADAAKHAGDSVTICDKVYSARWLENAKNQPTFLNLGEAYPNQLLTIVIWEDVRQRLGYKPEEKLLDKKVCVTGKIEEFRGKPQIVLHQPAQLKEE